jgi:transcriptional regulator with XRE-family HTH domain
MSGSTINPTDKYVGSRLRMRRLMLDMSQTNIAEALGLTFQQVQKYEKGSNRISASRLQHLGRAYRETDAAETDRGTIIRNFISGQYETPVRVVAFNTAEGWSRDVSEDIAHEVLDQAHDADETLTEGIKRFIDRHVTPGEKRPPARGIGAGVGGCPAR